MGGLPFDGKVIPFRQGGEFIDPADLGLPPRFDQVTVMLKFKSPETAIKPEHYAKGSRCNESYTYFDYPEHKLRMCSSAPSGFVAKPYGNLPYYPTFVVLSEKYPPYTIGLSSEVPSNVTTENVVEITTRFAYRGHWYWRLGAAGMFDLHARQPLKEVHRAMPAVEQLMNTWIVEVGKNGAH